MQTLHILKPEFHAEILCQRRMFFGGQMDFSAALHDLIDLAARVTGFPKSRKTFWEKEPQQSK